MPLQYYLMLNVITPDPDGYMAITTNERELLFLSLWLPKGTYRMEVRTIVPDKKGLLTGSLPDILTLS